MIGMCCARCATFLFKRIYLFPRRQNRPLRRAGLLGLWITLLGVPTSGSAFNLADVAATCVSGPCTQFVPVPDIVVDLAAGSVYGLAGPGLIAQNGDTFGVRVTILATGGPTGSAHSSVNVTPVNAWIHYSFEFVESFDPSTGTFGPDVTLVGANFVNILDVDSNGGRDFTDVAAVNLPVLSLGSALEPLGFDIAETPDAPTLGTEFGFARLSQNGDGTWVAEPNIGNNAPQPDLDSVTVSYDTGGTLTGFEFVWGSTSGPTPGRRDFVRGWVMAVDEPLEILRPAPPAPPAPPAMPDPEPVHVPISLPPLLGGIVTTPLVVMITGLLGLRRKRKTTRSD